MNVFSAELGTIFIVRIGNISADEFVSARARILAVHADALVDVEFIEAARCKGCDGSCTWFAVTKPKTLRLRVAHPLSVGQLVKVMLPSGVILVAAALVHGLPWAFLLLGALIGAYIGGSDLSCFVGAASGFAAALLLMPAWQSRLEIAISKRFRVVLES